MMPRLPLRLLVALAAASACGDGDGTGPRLDGLAFESAEAPLRAGAPATLVLRNEAGVRFGPIDLRTGPVENGAGLAQTGATVVGDPVVVPTLAPGASATVALTLHGADALGPGQYRSRLTARVAGTEAATVEVVIEVPPPSSTPVASLELGGPATLRRGDVARLSATARDAGGQAIDGAPLAWSVTPGDGGWVAPGGRFVAYRPGTVSIVATAGAAADTLTVAVTERGGRLAWRVAGQGLETRRFTSDLWVHGNHAWTGTWGMRAGDDGAFPGNLLRSWALGPGDPVATDSLILDARTTNDVKISADGTLGVVTHEGSEDGRNGVTLLDLSDPAHPRAVARFTQGLESGVHNAWLDGPWLYLVVDGVGSGLRILDVRDPADPRAVASYWAGESFLHDVIVRDGLAFLAHWDAGLVILDVGAGLAGGSPRDPVEIGRLRELGGQTHNVWIWPERGLAFVGEEDFGGPGRLHVVDVSEPRAPREVATFAVPGATPHNFWLDEEAEVLHVGWYSAGLVSLDVSGELLGELDRQGRELARWTLPGEAPACWTGMGSCVWAPQLHQGRLFLADVNRGLMVLEPGVP